MPRRIPTDLGHAAGAVDQNKPRRPVGDDGASALTGEAAGTWGRSGADLDESLGRSLVGLGCFTVIPRWSGALVVRLPPRKTRMAVTQLR